MMLMIERFLAVKHITFSLQSFRFLCWISRAVLEEVTLSCYHTLVYVSNCKTESEPTLCFWMTLINKYAKSLNEICLNVHILRTDRVESLI